MFVFFMFFLGLLLNPRVGKKERKREKKRKKEKKREKRENIKRGGLNQRRNAGFFRILCHFLKHFEFNFIKEINGFSF